MLCQIYLVFFPKFAFLLIVYFLSSMTIENPTGHTCLLMINMANWINYCNGPIDNNVFKVESLFTLPCLQ